MCNDGICREKFADSNALGFRQLHNVRDTHVRACKLFRNRNARTKIRIQDSNWMSKKTDSLLCNY